METTVRHYSVFRSSYESPDLPHNKYDHRTRGSLLRGCNYNNKRSYWLFLETSVYLNPQDIWFGACMEILWVPTDAHVGIAQRFF